MSCPVLFTELSGFWKGGVRKTTTANSRKCRGQAVGSLVTATFFKTSRICLFAAAYAAPYKVLKVVKHSSPRGPATHRCSVRSPGSCLESREWQHSNSGATLGGNHFSPLRFFPLSKSLAVQLLTSSFMASVHSSFCSFHPRQNRSSTRKSSLRGRYFLWQSLFSKWEEQNQRASSPNSWKIILAMFRMVRFRVCIPLVSSFTV